MKFIKFLGIVVLIFIVLFLLIVFIDPTSEAPSSSSSNTSNKTSKESIQVENEPSEKSLYVAATIFSMISESEKQKFIEVTWKENGIDAIEEFAKRLDSNPAAMAYAEAEIRRVTSNSSRNSNTNTDNTEMSEQIDAISKCLKWGGTWCKFIP